MSIDQMPVPAHLAMMVTNLAAPMDIAGLDTDQKLLWAAIRKVNTKLQEAASAFYYLALTQLKDDLVNIRVRIQFEDQRINYVLADAYMDDEDIVCIPKPLDYGLHWMRFTGKEETRYLITLRGRAAKVKVNDKFMDVRYFLERKGMEHSPISFPSRDTAGVDSVTNVALKVLETNTVSDTLLPGFELPILSRIKFEVGKAVEKGLTHDVI